MQKLLWVVLIAALGYGGFRVVSNRGSGDAGAVWEPYTVELGRLKDSIPCDGTLEPTTKTEIKSRVAGEIVQLLVEPGERVAAGQVLAQLDTEELVQEAREAAANLTAARAQYRLAQRGYSPTEAINRESQVAEAQIALDQAEA